MSNKLIKFKRHMNELAVKIMQLQNELCVDYDNEELRLDSVKQIADCPSSFALSTYS